MKNELQLFKNEKFGDVRFVEIDGKPYAVGKDIAKALGYKNTNDAINTHCKGVVKHEAFKINGSKIALIPQGDIIRLAVSCKLDGATEFESWIFDDVIPKILNTGKYDATQNKIEKIKDEKEKQLSLELYSLQQALKVNQSDLSLSILVNQKQISLNSYKQDKKIEQLGKEMKEQNKKIDDIFEVSDRSQFNREVQAVVRLTGVKQDVIYNNTYDKLKDIYSIDLKVRTKNVRNKAQQERLDIGKKPYSPSTLKSKYSVLNIADELSVWRELGKSLNAVKKYYMDKKDKE